MIKLIYLACNKAYIPLYRYNIVFIFESHVSGSGAKWESTKEL